MEQLVSALDHLRNQRIMHRDLKPESTSMLLLMLYGTLLSQMFYLALLSTDVLIASKAGQKDAAVVKLTDFGFVLTNRVVVSSLCCHLRTLPLASLPLSTESCRLAIDVPMDDAHYYGYAGTEGYMAPELEAGQPYFFEVDTWSMALVFYEVS